MTLRSACRFDNGDIYQGSEIIKNNHDAALPLLRLRFTDDLDFTSFKFKIYGRFGFYVDVFTSFFTRERYFHKNYRFYDTFHRTILFRGGGGTKSVEHIAICQVIRHFINQTYPPF